MHQETGGINTKERLRPANGLKERRCFPDRNTKCKCRNACIAAGNSRRTVQGVGVGAGREDVLQQHSGADRGAYQSGTPAKRLRLGDGSIFILKC